MCAKMAWETAKRIHVRRLWQGHADLLVSAILDFSVHVAVTWCIVTVIMLSVTSLARS